jgi:hypothetical protein
LGSGVPENAGPSFQGCTVGCAFSGSRRKSQLEAGVEKRLARVCDVIIDHFAATLVYNT